MVSGYSLWVRPCSPGSAQSFLADHIRLQGMSPAKNMPSVEGARRAPASSMQSPPQKTQVDEGESLHAHVYLTRGFPKVYRLIEELF